MKDKHQSLTRRSEDLYSNGVQHSPTAQDGFQENGCVDGCAARNGNQITESKEKEVPPRSTFLVDPANLCTLSGAIFSTIALAYIWNGRYNVGMALSMLANVMDIIDGQIARATPGRHPALGVVGAKMDCYSDVVSHFVVPSSLLMQLSELHPAAILVACLWVAAGIFRQAYFEVSERLDDGACIYGVTSDYMPTLAAIALHVLPLAGQDWACVLLVVFTIFMIYASLTLSLRSRRYTGYSLLFVTLFNLSLTCSCLFLAAHELQTASTATFWSFHGISLLVHVLLAYPCYFRFVELNW